MRVLVALVLTFVGWSAFAECREGENTTVVRQVEIPGGPIIAPGTPATVLKAGKEYLQVYFVAANYTTYVWVQERVLSCQ